MHVQPISEKKTCLLFFRQFVNNLTRQEFSSIYNVFIAFNFNWQYVTIIRKHAMYWRTIESPAVQVCNFDLLYYKMCCETDILRTFYMEMGKFIHCLLPFASYVCIVAKRMQIENKTENIRQNCIHFVTIEIYLYLFRKQWTLLSAKSNYFAYQVKNNKTLQYQFVDNYILFQNEEFTYLFNY